MRETIMDMWSEVLGVESISPGDDFFERGGDSLKATTLVAMIEEQLGVYLDTTAVFEFPVLADFLQQVREARDGASPPPAPDPRAERVAGAF